MDMDSLEKLAEAAEALRKIAPGKIVMTAHPDVIAAADAQGLDVNTLVQMGIAEVQRLGTRGDA